ncbi:MAG: hypothetical protein AAB503_00540 [Patescibacteria group bacterium]
MDNQSQYEVEKNLVEIQLSGEKITSNTNDLDLIAKVGDKLYKDNREFIKEKIRDNWFVIIEPVSGILFASPDQVKLFEYVKEKYPERLFYSVGLLKENQVALAR